MGHGSAGKGADAPGGGLVESHEANALLGGNGSIEGQVLNENGAPLKAVHVTVLRTSLFTASDKDGRFVFPSLLPGSYGIRADTQGYDSLEATVTVEAGSVTRALVTLLSLERNVGFIDHVHDFWGDGSEFLLFDDVVSQRKDMLTGGSAPPYACTGSLNPEISNGCFHVPVFPPDRRIVPPGTRELRAKVEWPGTDVVPAIEFRYTTANSTVMKKVGGVKPGAEFTIPVLDGENDHGHAIYTQWTFTIFQKPGAQGQAASASPINERFVGDYKVRMVAVKGTLYPESAHARHWAGGDRIELIAGETHHMNGTPAPRARDPRFTVCSNTINQVCYLLPAKRTVPPGTTRLDVTLTWQAPPAATAKPEDLSVAFRTSRWSPALSTLENLKVVDGAWEAGKVSYQLKISSDEADQFYQKKSTWMFLVANKGAERSDKFEPSLAPTPVGSVLVFEKFTLRVEAVNENWAADKAAGRI